MDTPDTHVCGVQFAPDAAGRRSSTTAERGIAAAALPRSDPQASTRAGLDATWNGRHFVRRGQPITLRRAMATPTSVLHNRIRAACRGAGAFGVEVFEPPATSAIVAALWVHDLMHDLMHDLRNPASAVCPAVAMAHPLQLLVDGASHGGLWRSPWLPRSVLPMVALRGLKQS